MAEMLSGVLALFLGWLCLRYVGRVRGLYSGDTLKRSIFYGDKPLMILPSTLGVLFILDGLGLLIMACMERLCGAQAGMISIQ
jgi:hypothetical protein